MTLRLRMEEVVETARGLSSRAAVLLAGAVLCLAAAVLSAEPAAQLTALAAGMTFVALILFTRGASLALAWRDRRRSDLLLDLVGADAAPCVATDAAGRVVYANAAARTRFGEDRGGAAADGLMALLRDHFASPSAVLFRLQARAQRQGAAREDVVTRRGHMRISATRLTDGRLLWRMEEFQDRTGLGRGAEGLSLPMLVANKTGVVLFSNEAMRRLLGHRPKRLDRVFTAPAIRPGEEVEVAGADGPVRAFLAEVPGLGERREIFLLPAPARGDPSTTLADFEHVPVALLKLSPDGEVQAANIAARDLVGLHEGDAARAQDLFDGLGRPVSDWLADVASGRLPGASEVLALRGGGEENFLQVTLRRTVEGGRPGLLAVLHDATALKRLEAQFNQSQKMQAIGQLAGGIAHDFNNLLTAISGHCDLLLVRHGREDTDYGDLVQIRQNSNRAAGLVAQLLAFSRKQTLSPERIDLHEVLGDLTYLLNRLVGERVRLVFDHDPLLGPIRVDRRQLEQVIMNLVVNARDAMAEGGTIRVETQALALAEDRERDGATIPAGEYAIVRVRDTGCGIPPERLGKIFEPFFTTKKPGEGTGLGLSTAYGIVKQSGGFIFVTSTVGVGTEFELFFPVQDIPFAEPSAEEPPRRMFLKPGEGTVLLVEDEAPVRAFASRALRMRGYTVIEAENGEEALHLLEDPALQVDVFVTDVVMPGLDGPGWVRQALDARPEVRVVFVSGYAEDCLSESQARIPNAVFLPKPFSLNALTETVAQMLA
jgi:two-component system cell cycle sensor histidine kinase/response regulator CckA